MSPPGLATSTWPWLFPPCFHLLLFFFCSSPEAQPPGHGTAGLTLLRVPARGHQHGPPAHSGDGSVTTGCCGTSIPAKGRAHLLPAHRSHPQGHQAPVALARPLHLQKRKLRDDEAILAGCGTREPPIPACISPRCSSAVQVSPPPPGLISTSCTGSRSRGILVHRGALCSEEVLASWGRCR